MRNSLWKWIAMHDGGSLRVIVAPANVIQTDTCSFCRSDLIVQAGLRNSDPEQNRSIRPVRHDLQQPRFPISFNENYGECVVFQASFK